MIKLVASDLDGTLIHGETTGLSQRTIDVIHRLTQKGIRFVVASGRQYDNERRLFHQIADEVSYIAENGSLCMHQGSNSSAFRLNPRALHRLKNSRCAHK